MSMRISNFLPYLFILITAVLMLGANPFNDEIAAPTDLLVNQPGWKNKELALTMRHPVRSDFLDARLPRWIHTKQSIRAGSLPSWNPYPINGIPGMQWLPASIFTPAFAVFSAIGDNATGLYYAMLTNLIIAAIGTYLLLLAMTGNRYASLFGAIVFAYSGFHAAWFYWEHVTTSIWIPWVLLFTYQYLHKQERRYLPWLSISIALMILGGFPSIAVYGLISFTLMCLIYAPWSKGIRPVTVNALNIIIFLIVGFLIPLFAIHSLYEMLQFTQASASRHGGTPFNTSDIIRFIKPLQGKYGEVERTFYVGFIPLLLFASIIPLFLLKYFSRNIFFALAILFLSASIVFSITPHNLVKTIPTFSTNNWGRMSVIITLAFSVLSAQVLSTLMTLNLRFRFHTLIPTSVAILLIILQTYDLKTVFRHFNGPVPASTFLPLTPSIDFIQESLNPLQSVLADNGFLVSGTLANYQIPEWFAHGFRAKVEVDVLNKITSDAFKTPTAAIIQCPNIKLSSDFLTFLGIRYILCNIPRLKGGIINKVGATTGARAIASPTITPSSPLIQYFNIGNPITVDIISLQLATYGRATSHADLTLSIYNNNKLLGQSTVDAKNILDNRWAYFVFDDSIHLDKANNHLVLEVTPVDSSGKLSVWLYPKSNSNVYIEQGDFRTEAVVAAKIFTVTDSPATKHILSHNIEPGITLLENARVTGSGYFLTKLDKTLQPDFEKVTLKHYEDTYYELQYTGLLPGWLVLPMRLYPGWQAYVDDRPVGTEAFLGMLPAIPVKPGAKISYRYEPNTLKMLSIFSLLSLISTFYMAVKLRKQ
ncbi:MAG: YfhO family protein [Candidatus Thiodiazotropha sp. (ex Epidulcina cf. delphinae)]|nr:YfhO family protein [Candidatus Thiodiazotropha sp. (ex Epidulcina cf. delphinae)]